MKSAVLTLHTVALETGKGDSVASKDDITLQVSSQPWRALKKTARAPPGTICCIYRCALEGRYPTPPTP